MYVVSIVDVEQIVNNRDCMMKVCNFMYDYCVIDVFYYLFCIDGIDDLCYCIVDNNDNILVFIY